jgi:hypothetical protein
MDASRATALTGQVAESPMLGDRMVMCRAVDQLVRRLKVTGSSAASGV